MVPCFSTENKGIFVNKNKAARMGGLADQAIYLYSSGFSMVSTFRN